MAIIFNMTVCLMIYLNYIPNFKILSKGIPKLFSLLDQT